MHKREIKRKSQQIETTYNSFKKGYNVTNSFIILYNFDFVVFNRIRGPYTRSVLSTKSLPQPYQSIPGARRVESLTVELPEAKQMISLGIDLSEGLVGPPNSNTHLLRC